MSKPSVGFIGIGIMGEPMAGNLLRAGFPLTLHSRTRARCNRLCEQGASWKNAPRDVASESDVIITMLPDSPDVEQVYLADRGIIKGLNRGATCIDMSTIAPESARRIADDVKNAGAHFLDAPVSGGKTGAESGKLVIMVGGEGEDVARVQPIFDALGKATVHCGPVSTGQLTKLCNQILCAVNLLGVSEAITFAKKVGIDPAVMLKAVSGGAAGSWALENLGPRMLSGDFAPMFMIDLQQKDLRIALDAAYEKKSPLPATALAHQLLIANQAAGEGREGTQALIKSLERLATRT